MALADPQSVTINSVAKSLALSSRSADLSVYKHATEGIQLELRKLFGPKTFRVQARLLQTRLDADAWNPAINSLSQTDAYLVIRGPYYGYSASEVQKNVEGLVDWLSDATIAKLIGGEI